MSSRPAWATQQCVLLSNYKLGAILTCITSFIHSFCCTIVINIANSILGAKDITMNETEVLFSWSLRVRRQTTNQCVYNAT
jgi:hypothetical protein